MLSRSLFYFFILLGSSLSAMLSGNLAEPNLMKKGIWLKPTWASLRVGYLDDWIYQQRFHDEFTFEGLSLLEFSTHAGSITLNFLNTLDLYGYVGSSQLQIDDQLYTKGALSWTVGGKLIVFKRGNFYLGTDVKYFQTSQKPKYFVLDGLPYNIVSHYRLEYEESQAALGMTYKISMFAPYINATYIFTRIKPEPAVVLVQLPDTDEIGDSETKSITCKNPWGMALGFSLVDCSKATLSFEWRLFNQNAINVNGELRF